MGFFRIKPIARLILKREISGSHTISDQSLLLSTIVLNDVRYFNTKVCPWNDNFDDKSFSKENIVGIFVKMLYIIKSDWQLQITVIENDVVIAYKVKFNDLRKHYNSDANKLDYNFVNKSCSILYSLNSPGCVELLYNKLLHKQSVPNELFVYGNIKSSLMIMNSFIELISHHHHNISAVLVGNDVTIGHNPNI